jgi:hypothetical protein
MDKLLITWTFIVILGIGIDVLVYVLLRAEWKKRGVIVTDEFLKKVSERLGQMIKALRKPAPAKPQPQPNPSSLASEVPIVELIPVSVESIGQIRRVQFSMEMPLNTTMEVRIGATLEAGVTVEKREL